MTLQTLLKKYTSLEDCRVRIESWLSDPSIDENSKKEISELIDKENVQELRDRFYRELEFGTGGLRGITGAGNNRMNKYVVRRAAQGLANFIIQQGQESCMRGVAIAYDCRLSSEEFGKEMASVMAGNGIRAFIFPTLQTTPLLSFAIRDLKCISGICVTASHNPPQYNGAKVYWDDGAQIIPPQDKGILSEVFAVSSFNQIKVMEFDEGLKKEIIHFIPDDVTHRYSQAVAKLQLFPHIEKNLRAVYTPLHGTGAVSARQETQNWGYTQFSIVPEQEKPDGHFPTVSKPNPEEPKALTLLAEFATKQNADIALASDPDSDRLAVVIKDKKAAEGLFKDQAMGEYVLLNGNQTGALLIDYILESRKKNNTLKKEHKIVKTIVTSDLHKRICNEYGVEIFDTLTGFKWIAGLVRSWEDQKLSHEFLFGTEESFGFMPGPYVRDKDGIGALCQALEMAQILKNEGKTCCDRLVELFEKHGAWHEDLLSIDLEGEEGALRISRMMDEMRSHPKKSFDGVAVKEVHDYKLGIKLPPSNVLQFELVDGSRISMRPSGTEPKIKFYFSVCTQMDDVSKAFVTSQNRIGNWVTEIKDFIAKVK